MTAQSKTVIKTYFNTGDRPTEAQFANLIDSYQDTNSVLTTLASASVGAAGLGVLAAITTAAAQSALGGGTVGAQIFACTTTAAATNIIGGGDMNKAVYDAANIAQQLVGLTASQSLTNKSVNGVILTTGGSSTQFLNGAGNYVAASGITLGTPVASTSGTSIDFTGIPSTAKKISINFVGVSTNGSDALLIQLGDSGGIETTGYLGAGVQLDAGSMATVNYTAGFGIPNPVGAAASVRHGTIFISLENSSANTWCASGSLGYSNAANASLISGSKSTSATLDRVRITTTGGTNTFDAGEINISYE